MPENKMWLVHKPTGERIKLAKYYRATGWHVIPTADDMCNKFHEVSYAHLSAEQRATIDRRADRGPPFARGSLLGDDWILQYDHVRNVNYRNLKIQPVSFGSVSSDDLFAEKEQALFDFYERSKTRYKKALDIGANIGVHTMLMARNGWQVDAYEPDPVHMAELWTNCANNKLFPAQVNLQAVSNRNGEAQFTRVLGNTTGSHLTGMKDPYGDLETFGVEVVDAAPLLAWADFAKIDAEGAEALILSRLEPWMTVECMVEIGNAQCLAYIFDHLNHIGRRSWSQKTGWKEVRHFDDAPKHHSEGALFIGNEPPCS